MPGAKIRIDQPTGAGSGTAGLARDGIWQSQQVNLVSVLTGNTTQLWEFVDIPTGSSATISNPTSVTASFTPDQPGTYIVKLTTNDGSSGNVQIRVVVVTKDSSGSTVRRGWRFPGFKEKAEMSTGIGSKGWADALEQIFTDLLSGSLPIGALGTVLAGTGASSNFTNSPTLTGLTLTGFSGIVKATAGVLAAGMLALSDLPQGTNGTVLTGVTSSAPAYSATPTLTAVKFGTTPSLTGCIRAEVGTTIVAYRYSGADYPVLSSTTTEITLGGTTTTANVFSATATGSVIFKFDSNMSAYVDATGIVFNNSRAIYGGDTAGGIMRSFYINDSEIYIGDGQYCTIVQCSLVDNVPFKIEAIDTANSISLYSDSSEIKIAASSNSLSMQIYIDPTTNASGAPIYLVGQTALTTGGSVYIDSGSGGTSNGYIYFCVGGSTPVITINNTGKDIIFSSTLASAISIYQADKSTNSATGATFNIQAQNCTGTTAIGGALALYTGTGTSRAGYMLFYRGSTQRGQIGSGSSGNGGIWWGRSNTASGNDSIILGTSNTASNDFSIAIGNSNSSGATVSIALGTSNSIGGSADYSIAIGYMNTINTSFSYAIGISCTANQQGSVAMGVSSTTSSYAEIAQASGAASGTPQNSTIQVSGTTSATATTSVDLKAGPSSNLEITTRSNRLYAVEVTFVATSASFTIVGRLRLKNALIKNNGGTVTVIDAGDVVGSTTTPTDWTITLSGSGNYLRVTFSKTANANALYCGAKVQLVDIGKP